MPWLYEGSELGSASTVDNVAVCRVRDLCVHIGVPVCLQANS